MRYELVFKEEAKKEVVDSYHWYEQQHVGLGESFLEEIDKYIALIIANPFAYSTRHNNKRAAILKRFPYIIVYESLDPQIVIYAVFNTHQDPSKWVDRK